MREFYTFAWILALPFVLLRLWWRGLREPGYREHLGERLGSYGRRLDGRMTIWVHAVSVGETRAAEPLVDALLEAYPSSRLVLTHMTPTGRATGKALFGRHGERVLQAYLPYDIGLLMQRFLRHFAPRVCILMETEVWPNLIAACGDRIPVALVNARLSERSLKRGRRYGGLMVEAARGLALVAAQTEEDALRIRALGASRVEVTGSLKFDVDVPQEAVVRGNWLRAQIGDRPVLLCASTREGEEAMLLEAFEKSALLPEGTLLLLVPRHPQRFDEVAAMVKARGLRMVRRSALPASCRDAQVVLGDSMGEMFAYCAAADVAFIGGSLLPLGGQNLIEACALGKPVLLGPHTFNFLKISADAIASGAALRVRDANHLMGLAADLLIDDEARARMGELALAFSNQHRGATARTIALLSYLIH
jgi:3-deoxy-D-manno-octulosonic-acid transferase